MTPVAAQRGVREHERDSDDGPCRSGRRSSIHARPGTRQPGRASPAPSSSAESRRGSLQAAVVDSTAPGRRTSSMAVADLLMSQRQMGSDALPQTPRPALDAGEEDGRLDNRSPTPHARVDAHRRLAASRRRWRSAGERKPGCPREWSGTSSNPPRRPARARAAAGRALSRIVPHAPSAARMAIESVARIRGGSGAAHRTARPAGRSRAPEERAATVLRATGG